MEVNHLSPAVRDFMARMEEKGGEEWLFAEIAARRTPRELSAELGYSAAVFYQWVNSDRARLKQLLADAREYAADIAAEQAGEVFDTVTGATTSAQASAINGKSKWLQWLASKYNRGTYGDTPAVQINQLTIGAAHLQALMQGGRRLVRAVPVDAPQLEAGDDASTD